MPRNYPVLLVLLISVASGMGCMKTSKNQEIKASDGGTPGPQKPLPTRRALIVGDSLSAGFGATKSEITPAGCLTRQTGTTSLVRAAAGATTFEILQQIKDAANDPAALVFLSAGGNDVLEDVYGSGYSEEETLKNFAAIIAELKTRETRVVYLSLNPPVKSASRLPRLGRMAAEAGFVVVDGMKDFWGQKELMSDRIHPNDKGYQKICERVLAALTTPDTSL